MLKRRRVSSQMTKIHIVKKKGNKMVTIIKGNNYVI